MEHQDWSQTVLKKTGQSKIKNKGLVAPDASADACAAEAYVAPKKAIVPNQDALDFDEKKVEWFTPSMGKKIQSLRAQQKLNQEQLALKLRVSKNVVADMEYGNKVKYQGALVKKLKEILGNFEW